MLLIDSENASHPLNQSGVKITPPVTLSFTFSRALGSFTLSSHWLHEIPSFLFLCLAMVITFIVSFQHYNGKALWCMYLSIGIFYLITDMKEKALLGSVLAEGSKPVQSR